MEELTLTEQERVRREKMQALRDKGIDPFGSAFHPTHHSAEIFGLYGDKTKEELTEIDQKVTIAGRIMTKRDMGKAGFMHLLDRSFQVGGIGIGHRLHEYGMFAADQFVADAHLMCRTPGNG